MPSESMKRYLIYIILMILPVRMIAQEQASAVERKLTFGAEWGYIGTFFSGYHDNFFSPEGWRVDEQDYGIGYFSNAEVYLHIGYNIDNNWNISLYTGYAGIQDVHHCIPISVRGTRFFRENGYGDRMFAFVDLGSGISLKKHPQEILTGKLGCGYRLSFSGRTKVDLLASLRATYSHRDIIFDNIEIPFEKTNRNNVYGCSLSLGISISF